MGSARDGDFSRWEVPEIGSLGDGEFTRIEV